MATPEIRKKVERALESSEFVEVAIADLNIDHTYQRDLNMTLVQRLAASWNPVAGEPILVSKRKSGKMYVINGQHRTSAKKIIGAETILARVVSGLDTASEAEMRLITNVQVGERPHERFKAQLAANYKESWEILNIITSKGVELNLDRSNYLEGLNAVSTIEVIYRVDRGQTLKLVVDTLSKLYSEVNSQTGSAGVLRALAWFFTRHENEYNDDWLVKGLKAMGSAAWARLARDQESLQGGSLWLNFYRVLIDAYNDAAPAGGQLTLQTRGSTRLKRIEDMQPGEEPEAA